MHEKRLNTVRGVIPSRDMVVQSSQRKFVSISTLSHSGDKNDFEADGYTQQRTARWLHTVDFDDGNGDDVIRTDLYHMLSVIWSWHVCSKTNTMKA